MQVTQSRELCLDHTECKRSDARSIGISISRILAKSGSKISMVVECVANPEENAKGIHLWRSLSALCWCLPQHAKLAKSLMVLSVRPSRYAADANLWAAVTWISWGGFRKNSNTIIPDKSIFKENVVSNQMVGRILISKGPLERYQEAIPSPAPQQDRTLDSVDDEDRAPATALGGS